jgi:hypothetical protein
MKMRVWCDSGANAHSKREEIVDLSDLGVSDEKWAEMSEEEREATMKEVAFAELDWGYAKIESAKDQR